MNKTTKRKARKKVKQKRAALANNYVYNKSTCNSLNKLNKRTKKLINKEYKNDGNRLKEYTKQDYIEMKNKGMDFILDQNCDNDNRKVDNTLFETPIISINLHKSRSPALEVSRLADELNSPIILGQEPPLNKNGKIDALVRDSCIYFSENPRACIYHNKNMNLIGCPSLSSRDFVAAIWTRSNLHPKLLVCSVYFDQNNPVELGLAELQRAADFANANNYDIKISGDFNAHSDLWGGPERDNRGIEI